MIIDAQVSMSKVEHALDKINKLGDDAMSKLEMRYENKNWDKAMYVDQRYRKLRWPLYEERSRYIRVFPDFWRIACLNKLRYRLTEEDIKVFKYLKTLTVKGVEDVEYAYSITFDFDVNPYFTYSSLKKSYKFENYGIADITSSFSCKDGRDITYGPNENILLEQRSSNCTDKSFFKWFSNPGSEDWDRGFYDKVAEEIEDDLWPNAVRYFLMTMTSNKEEELKMMADRLVQRDALEKLKEIQETINQMNHEKFVALKIVNELCTKKLKEEKMLLKRDLNNFRRAIYQSEIVKSIPKFWLIAFLSHTLGHLLSEDDQKIFEFLNYVDVEYTSTNDRITGFVITLEFGENPYLKNASLAKTFSFTTTGETYIKGPIIKWKDDGMDIFVRRGDERMFTIYGTSFFTWFCDSDHLTEGLCDEVAELIRDDLWPNAFQYFLSKK